MKWRTAEKETPVEGITTLVVYHVNDCKSLGFGVFYHDLGWVVSNMVGVDVKYWTYIPELPEDEG
jgi:hypothetical protein